MIAPSAIDASEGGPRRLAALAGPERRFVAILRGWAADPQGVWDDLAADLGAARARACLNAFEDVLILLKHSAWRLPQTRGPDDPGLSADEDDLCALVMAACEGRREDALARALLMVREGALLPLVHAASRLGLPLLCADCRLRLLRAQRRH